MFKRDVIADVLAGGRITADHVLMLRRSIYADGKVEPGEIDRLFTIDEAATEQDPSWAELFCEAIADYLVGEVEPIGDISEKNASWLIARISRDGAVKSRTALEALVRVLEQAKKSPEGLVAFALQQVKRTVVETQRPPVRGKPLPGGIGRDDVELLRRVLYAFGGNRNIAITRSEAQILFDINDATAAAENDPSWNDLFVKAIANLLMAACGYTVPPRHEALHGDELVGVPSGGAGDFVGHAPAEGLRGVWKAYRQASVDAASSARAARVNAESGAVDAVTADEAEWLAGRMGRDGIFHENEKALLRFIRDEASSIHPALRLLIARAA